MCNIRNEQDLLTCIKLDLGLVNTVWHGRRQYVIPGSISFAAMDETEFQTFYNRTIDIILSTYLRGLDRKALLEEVEHFK